MTVQKLIAEPRPQKSSLISILLLLFLVAVAAAALYEQTPPAAVPSSAPPSEFSSMRAMEDLQVIARDSHPIGSPAHADVRGHLVKELAAMGLEPQVQEATVVNASRGAPYAAATVRNVAARLYGANNTRAILLVAHYDSVPISHGSNDDGAGVATILETLRSLKASPPLNNDVIALFTDGEEAGLLGAKAFADEHPWVKDVGLVLNFEARGSSGPVVMFETSSGNGRIVSEFARAAPRPVASSLTYDIYKLLPNDTDLTVFKGAGLAGLNFAYIGGVTQYHTLLDSLQNTDPDTVQHQGSYALALTRHFGNLNLENIKSSDIVYFDLLGRVLVRYSGALIIPLTILAALAFAAVIVYGFKKGRLTAPGMVFGSFAYLFAMTIAACAVFAAWWLIHALHGGDSMAPWGVAYNSWIYEISFTALAIAVTSSLYIWFQRKTSTANLAAGALVWWLLLVILSALYLRGGSYLFTWPLLFSLPAFALLLSGGDGRGDGRQASAKTLLILSACALPALILLAPIIRLLFAALTITMAAAVTVFVVLLLGLLVPHLALIASPKRWLLPVLAAAVCVAFIAAGILTNKVSKNYPQTSMVFYALNGDTGKAIWAGGQHLDGWNSQFFSGPTERGPLTEFFPLGSGTYMKAQAPAAALPAPDILLLGDAASDGIRTLRLRVTSPRQAPILSLQLDSDAEIRAATINGKPVQQAGAQVTAQSRKWGLRYYSLPKEGLDLTLEVAGGGPVRLVAVDQSYGLPDAREAAYSPRPDYLMPQPHPLSDCVLVAKSYTF
ncbi:MAG: M20/M25/M40 family metallo-hydrolase [Blastocatellia bacterium]